jgi:hypothetical protein
LYKTYVISRIIVLVAMIAIDYYLYVRPGDNHLFYLR